jgi:hypothetical protein
MSRHIYSTGTLIVKTSGTITLCFIPGRNHGGGTATFGKEILDGRMSGRSGKEGYQLNYTVKKLIYFPVPNRDILAGDGKIDNLFLQ